MAGYVGYSMSRNAVAAYNDGEKPLSKFTKKDYTFFCEVVKESLGLEVKPMTLKEFKKFVEENCESSWHHTSKMYNKTYFYDVIYFLTSGAYTSEYWEDLHNDVVEAIKEEYESAYGSTEEKIKELVA